MSLASADRAYLMAALAGLVSGLVTLTLGVSRRVVTPADATAPDAVAPQPAQV